MPTAAVTSLGPSLGPPTPPQPARPTSIADFELLKTLGTGNFGRVLLAASRHNRQLKAVKVLSKAHVLKTKQVGHILSEKTILASIDCEFCVTFEASFKDNANLYIVLDYCAGGELFYHLQKAGAFDEPAMRFISREVMAAIRYLHCRNIMYRDLKPENIMLTEAGHVKLTDFGFAKQVDHMTWTICGTPEYMAPEIVLGRGYTKGCDWYAVGVLLYEMRAGRPPYEGTAMEIYKALSSRQAPLCPGSHFSAALADLVRSLCHHDLTRRLGITYGRTPEQHAWFGLPTPTTPPIVPGSGGPNAGNFDTYDDAPLATSAVVIGAVEFHDF